MEKTSIGERIAIRRKEIGMTQEEVAEKMGYKSKSSINKIEKGLSDIPQSKIVKFAEVLRTTTGYLMGWLETEKPNLEIELTEITDKFDDEQMTRIIKYAKLIKEGRL